MNTIQKIIGIDPGYTNIGYSLLEVNVEEKKVVSILHGTIVTKSGIFREKLIQIGLDFNRIFGGFSPDIFAYEVPFFTGSTLQIGNQVYQALGVIRYLSEKYHTKEFGYSATEIKKIITGSGKSDKNDIVKALKKFIPKEIFQTDHASDAVAISLSYAIKNGIVSEIQI